MFARLLTILLFITIFSSCSDAISAEGIDYEEVKKMELYLDGSKIPVIWENNESTKALASIVLKNKLEISASLYGGFEQVGSLGSRLVSNDKRISTKNGDIMLYSSSNIVLLFGSNTYSYTPLGRIDLPAQEVIRLLDKAKVQILLK